MSDEQRQRIDGQRVVEVYRANDVWEARLVSEALDQSGIANRIEGEFLQGAVGEVPPGWQSAPRIMVLEPDAENARVLIDGWHRSRRSK